MLQVSAYTTSVTVSTTSPQFSGYSSTPWRTDIPSSLSSVSISRCHRFPSSITSLHLSCCKDYVSLNQNGTCKNVCCDKYEKAFTCLPEPAITLVFNDFFVCTLFLWCPGDCAAFAFWTMTLSSPLNIVCPLLLKTTANCCFWTPPLNFCWCVFSVGGH